MSNKTFVADLIKHNKKIKVETSVADLIKPKKKYLYACYCILCNGEEVDPRTQKKHAKDERLWRSKDAKKDQENAIMARKQSQNTNLISDVNSTRINSNQSKRQKIDNSDSFHLNKPDNEEEESINIPFSFNFCIPALTFDKNDNIVDYFNEENDYNINQNYIYQEEEEDDDDNIDQKEENEDEDNIKNIFTSPEFDSDEVFVMESLNDSLETEIILWAFKF
ncbi:hypothetical protein RhiirA5_412263 [Rhizophagus irregularis]|uniref:Uncharacterized protein n=1 Tax=Rhizophagus irregularis TaxID=588596 RepID=A0A2N0PZ61_9GLOM|nr:hypothetical protein RhiirA5_412263 [Rhizophagus irregularis]